MIILAVATTLGIGLVVIAGVRQSEFRLALLCWVSVLALVWVWIAQQEEQFSRDWQAAYHRCILQCQLQQQYQTPPLSKTLSGLPKTYFADQALFVSTPFALERLGRKPDEFEDSGANGALQKSGDTCVAFCAINDQARLGSFSPTSPKIPSRIRLRPQSEITTVTPVAGESELPYSIGGNTNCLVVGQSALILPLVQPAN